MQIEPGPIPTLTISTPALANNFAALPVAIFPAQIIEFFEIFFILFIIVKTFLVWPWAVSTTIKSTLDSNNLYTLSISFSLVPTAAPTIGLPFLSFDAFGKFSIFRISWVVYKPTILFCTVYFSNFHNQTL